MKKIINHCWAIESRRSMHIDHWFAISYHTTRDIARRYIKGTSYNYYRIVKYVSTKVDYV